MTTASEAKGPLHGVSVVEMAGLGPAPFCGMLVADMGAEVIRVDRLGDADLGIKRDPRFDIASRGKRSVAIDIKCAAGRDAVLRLVEQADVWIEGFRSGVMERLGLGPEPCLALNPGLIFGRITGWGQQGPLAQAAGHDLNYIALTGALEAIGEAGRPPVAPLNLVGDFGGGSMYLAFGIASALVERARSGRGLVIDAAIIDGVSSLLAGIHGQLVAPGKRNAVITWCAGRRHGTRLRDGRRALRQHLRHRTAFLRRTAVQAGAGPDHAARPHEPPALAGAAQHLCGHLHGPHADNGRRCWKAATPATRRC